MHRNIFYYLLVFFITSCGSSKIPITTTQNITFEYDKSVSLNYGDSIAVSFYNVSLSQEKTDISSSQQMKVYGDGIRYESKTQYLYIDKRPVKKDVSSLFFTTALGSKGDSVLFEQELKLTFSAPLKINLAGEDGDKANNRIGRLRPAVRSEGKEGKAGRHGVNGEDALPAKVHIWKENSTFYAKVTLTNSDSVWIYQSTNVSSFIIDASGGAGGNAGNGGNGSGGRNGNIAEGATRQPGNGGDGGNGGHGGFGGKGAKVEVIVHPNAAEILPVLKVINHGGIGGNPGEGGKAGKAGTPASGQTPAIDGQPGKDGEKGIDGANGAESIITSEEFSFEGW